MASSSLTPQALAGHDLPADAAQDLLAEVKQIVQAAGSPCQVRQSCQCWGREICLSTRSQTGRMLQAWQEVSKQVLRQDHPFRVHQQLHRYIFREWSAKSQV